MLMYYNGCFFTKNPLQTLLENKKYNQKKYIRITRSAKHYKALGQALEGAWPSTSGEALGKHALGQAPQALHQSTSRRLGSTRSAKRYKALGQACQALPIKALGQAPQALHQALQGAWPGAPRALQGAWPGKHFKVAFCSRPSTFWELSREGCGWGSLLGLLGAYGSFLRWPSASGTPPSTSRRLARRSAKHLKALGQAPQAKRLAKHMRRQALQGGQAPQALHQARQGFQGAWPSTSSAPASTTRPLAKQFRRSTKNYKALGQARQGAWPSTSGAPPSTSRRLAKHVNRVKALGHPPSTTRRLAKHLRHSTKHVKKLRALLVHALHQARQGAWASTSGAPPSTTRRAPPSTTRGLGKHAHCKALGQALQGACFWCRNSPGIFFLCPGDRSAFRPLHLPRHFCSMVHAICSILEPIPDHAACYLQHFGAGTFYLACYVPHLGAGIFHLYCYLRHLGAGTCQFACYL